MRPAFSSVEEDFVSRYFERFVARSGSQAGFVLRHPIDTVGLLRRLRTLPVLDMRLSRHGVQADAIRGQLERTLLRRHALGGATAVLQLPEDAADYTRGSSKSTYTLRKRSRTARELGVRVERVDAAERRRELRLLAEAYERVNPRDEFRIEDPDDEDMLEHRFWFVATLEGRPILLAVLPADGPWAALRYFRTLESSDAATLARYLVMVEVVAALSANGVRHVVVGMGPHRIGNGIRQFQRMMGFRIVRLVIGAGMVLPELAPWLGAAGAGGGPLG